LTILESFGNFSTLKNLNCSSFLNLVELNFSKSKYSGSLITASFINPHRVVFPKNGRNFHIFYQIFSESLLREKYQLEDISHYKILNSISISGIDDSNSFQNTKESSQLLEISLEEYFDIVVAILKIGNLNFNEDGSIKNKEQGFHFSIHSKC
jgi:myosin heavy subunit